MKKLGTVKSIILVLALLSVLVFILWLAWLLKINSSDIAQEASILSPLATPTPAPWETAIPVATATPRTPLIVARTIDLTEGTPVPQEEIARPDATFTLKPEPFARIVDLANGTPFPSAEIIPLLVRRANGTLEKYLIPLTLLPDLTTQTLNRLVDAKPCDAVLRPMLAQPKELPEGVRRIPTPVAERFSGPPYTCTPVSLPYDMATFNLAGDLPDEEIAVVIVLRIIGVYEKYLLPLEPVMANNTVEGLDTYLHFAPGDALLDGHPLAPKRQAAYPPPLNEQGGMQTVTPSPTFYIPHTPGTYTGQLTTSTPAPPTVTPSKIINLAEEIPLIETVFYIVSRSDGTIEMYIVPESIIPRDETRFSFIDRLLNIGAQDQIINVKPQGVLPMEGLPPAREALASIQSLVSLAEVVNLANGTPLPDDEMWPLLVRRASGALQKYLVPMTLLPDLSLERISQVVSLQPCDAILQPATISPQELTERARYIPSILLALRLPSATRCPIFTPPAEMKTFVVVSTSPGEWTVVVVVLRTTGLYERYILPLDPSVANALLEEIDNYAHFVPGDVILEDYPLLVRRQSAYPTFPDTPTPAIGEHKVGPTPTITPTPSKIIDLSAGALSTRTMVYVVKRADGSFEKYLIADTLIPPDETRQKVRDKLLNLGPQDVIIDSHPLDSLPMVPPALTPPLLSTTVGSVCEYPCVGEATAEVDRPGPTPTPKPEPKVFNLAKGLADEQIYVVLVVRANGDYEKYLLPLAPFVSTHDFMGELAKQIGFTSQDHLVDAYSLITHFPPRMPPSLPDSMITPIANPE